MSKQPKAELIGKPENPIGLLYFIWMQSRSNDKLETPAGYDAAYVSTLDTTELLQCDIDWAARLRDLGTQVSNTVKQLLDEDVPVLENLYFTFHLTNIPVSLREQMVRHRVGVHVGPLQGLDQIPELGSSSFWSQTSRMVPMDTFAEEGRYHVPQSVDDVLGSGEHNYYKLFMERAQEIYENLLADGVPMEDARQVLPLAATQSMTWTLSLKTIIHVIGKRACWIAQYGLWGKIIADIARELKEKVSPLLGGIVQPPCMKKGKFVSCPIDMINRDRVVGIDPYPPCPLWAHHNAHYRTGADDTVWRVNALGQLETFNVLQKDMYERMHSDFRTAWGLNPETGAPL